MSKKNDLLKSGTAASSSSSSSSSSSGQMSVSSVGSTAAGTQTGTQLLDSKLNIPIPLIGDENISLSTLIALSQLRVSAPSEGLSALPIPTVSPASSQLEKKKTQKKTKKRIQTLEKPVEEKTKKRIQTLEKPVKGKTKKRVMTLEKPVEGKLSSKEKLVSSSGNIRKKIKPNSASRAQESAGTMVHASQAASSSSSVASFSFSVPSSTVPISTLPAPTTASVYPSGPGSTLLMSHSTGSSSAGIVPSVPIPTVEIDSLPKVKDHLLPIFQADFEDQEQNIIRWLALAEEPRVQEYLTKLLTQVKIAGRVLLTPERLNEQHAKKLITLWKCAKRKDVSDFFKLKEHLRDATEETVQNETSTQVDPKGQPETNTQVDPKGQPETKFDPGNVQAQLDRSTLPGKDEEIQFGWLLEDGSLIRYREEDQKILRAAAQSGDTEVTLNVEDRQYRINLKTLIQVNVTSGVERPIFMFSERTMAPIYWSEMEKNRTSQLLYGPEKESKYPLETFPKNLHNSYLHFEPKGRLPVLLYAGLIALGLGCPGYNVSRITLNQNPELWLRYSICREMLNSPELPLWHGTDAKSVHKICSQGFRPEYTKNYNYGQGCYFARSPALSARTEYAKFLLVPEAEGGGLKQFVILSLVVPGITVVGNKDNRFPLSLASSQQGMFRAQSMVDVLPNSKIYVVPASDQAYPLAVFELDKQPTLSLT